MYLPWSSYAQALYFTEIAIHSSEAGCNLMYALIYFHHSFLLLCMLVQVKPVKGVYIFRFQSPLYFANGAVFKTRLASGSGIDPYRTKDESPGCFTACCRKVGM